MIVLLAVFVFMAGLFVAEQSIVYVIAAALIVIFTSLSIEALYRKNVISVVEQPDYIEEKRPEVLDESFVQVILSTVCGQEILATFDSRVVPFETVKFFVKGYLTANGYPSNLVYISPSRSSDSVVYSYGKNSTDRKEIIKITNVSNFSQEEKTPLIAAYA